MVAAACRLIESAEQAPSLEALAAEAGLSVYHLHRVFKAATGLTPKAYAAAHRARRVRAELARSGTVTEAIYGAGYNSNGRFYAQSNDVLGMTPSRYRAGGDRYRDPLRDRRVLARRDPGRRDRARRLRDPARRRSRGIGARAAGPFPARRADRRRCAISSSWSRKSSAWSRRRSSGWTCRSTFAAPRSSSASGRRLREIPAGKTLSYGELAKRIGAPNSVRAVAQACAANALAVAIPCHRVVRNDGALSGYRWGVERKRALLEREARRMNARDRAAGGIASRRLSGHV